MEKYLKYLKYLKGQKLIHKSAVPGGNFYFKIKKNQTK